MVWTAEMNSWRPWESEWQFLAPIYVGWGLDFLSERMFQMRGRVIWGCIMIVLFLMGWLLYWNSSVLLLLQKCDRIIYMDPCSQGLLFHLCQDCVLLCSKNLAKVSITHHWIAELCWVKGINMSGVIYILTMLSCLINSRKAGVLGVD